MRSPLSPSSSRRSSSASPCGTPRTSISWAARRSSSGALSSSTPDARTSSSPPRFRALHGWTPFIAMQDQYNLIKREEEREMLPLCADLGVGCIPYSPQGKGRLTRPWGEQTQRSEKDAVAKTFDLDVDQPVVEAVQKVAAARGTPMSQVALAWLLSKPVVTAPIAGATKPHHLADAVAALDVKLSDDEIQMLEEPYTPQAPYWF